MRPAGLSIRVTFFLAALTACGRTKERADSGTNGAGGTGGAGGIVSGGTAGTGGAQAGVAGSSGGIGAAAGAAGGTAGAGDCLDLSRAPTGRYDFRVVGSGFDAYDGETVRAVVIAPNHPGYGVAQTTIRNGAFEISLARTNEPYTGYGVYIDRGRDDACTLNVDPFFQMVSGGVYEDVNWEINPQTSYNPALPPCNIDAIFDLTQPLSCSSGVGGVAGSIGAGGTTGVGGSTAGSGGTGAGGVEGGSRAQVQLSEGRVLVEHGKGARLHNLLAALRVAGSPAFRSGG